MTNEHREAVARGIYELIDYQRSRPEPSTIDEALAERFRATVIPAAAMLLVDTDAEAGKAEVIQIVEELARLDGNDGNVFMYARQVAIEVMDTASNLLANARNAGLISPS